LMREVDTENNILVNGVSFDQFCQIATKKEKDIYTHEDIIEAFQTFDTKSTGFLSKDILTEALCGYGEKLSTDEFEAMIKIGGLDADGKRQQKTEVPTKGGYASSEVFDDEQQVRELMEDPPEGELAFELNEAAEVSRLLL
uniref:EF-hand domain-containing protein n=1 Tax=Schistocephalus solidus TaxID=70667 RepID=A0A183SXR8_SCHSO